jgi:hypothetical protein
MARLNPSYGSELHLLRMLGRHRDYLNRKVCEGTRAEHVEWLDFPSGEKRTDKQGNVLWDREWHQLQFLPPADLAKKAWQAAWPAHRTGHSWDAIGRIRLGMAHEWLLVEAKANTEEMSSGCQAADRAGRSQIERALNATKAELGGAADRDWTQPYYQFCNRLVALHVLSNAGTPARLLYIYFYGDVGDQRRTCPESEDDWRVALARQDQHVGLPSRHALRHCIHKLFLDAQCLERSVLGDA